MALGRQRQRQARVAPGRVCLLNHKTRKTVYVKTLSQCCLLRWHHSVPVFLLFEHFDRIALGFAVLKNITRSLSCILLIELWNGLVLGTVCVRSGIPMSELHPLMGAQGARGARGAQAPLPGLEDSASCISWPFFCTFPHRANMHCRFPLTLSVCHACFFDVIIVCVCAGWVSPLLSRAAQNKGLLLHDLPPPSAGDDPRLLHDSFAAHLADTPAAGGGSRWLFRTLHRAYYSRFYGAGLLMLVAQLGVIAKPLLLQRLLQRLEGPDDAVDGTAFAYAGGLFAANVASTLSIHLFWYLSIKLGVHVKSVLMCHVLQTLLRMPPADRRALTAGKVASFMTIDAARTGSGIVAACHWDTWAPLMLLVVSLYFLWQLLGVSWNACRRAPGFLLCLNSLPQNTHLTCPAVAVGSLGRFCVNGAVPGVWFGHHTCHETRHRQAHRLPGHAHFCGCGSAARGASAEGNAVGAVDARPRRGRKAGRNGGSVPQAAAVDRQLVSVAVGSAVGQWAVVLPVYCPQPRHTP